MLLAFDAVARPALNSNHWEQEACSRVCFSTKAATCVLKFTTAHIMISSKNTFFDFVACNLLHTDRRTQYNYILAPVQFPSNEPCAAMLELPSRKITILLGN